MIREKHENFYLSKIFMQTCTFNMQHKNNYEANFNLEVNSIVMNSFSKFLKIQTLASIIVHDTKCSAKRARAGR